MRSTFNSVIHKPVVTLEVDRNTQVDAKTVEKLHNAIAGRGVVIATPTTIKAVVLKYVEACEVLTDVRRRRDGIFGALPTDAATGSTLPPPPGAGAPDTGSDPDGAAAAATAAELAAAADDDAPPPEPPELKRAISKVTSDYVPDLERTASELGRLLRLFQDGAVILDEVDLILHPLKSELNFPIGDKLDLDFSPLRWNFAIHLLDAIFYGETKTTSVGFEESELAKKTLARLLAKIDDGYKQRALQRSPHLVLLNVDYYHEELKPVLAEWCHHWLQKHHLIGLERNDALKFMCEGAHSDLHPELAARLNDPSKVDAKHVQMLTLARDWLHSYLPHCLTKINRVSFGIFSADDYNRALELDPYMPRSRAKLAIPFVGKDVPSRSSEFAHPDVIIGLSILAYRYSGMRYSDFDQVCQTN